MEAVNAKLDRDRQLDTEHATFVGDDVGLTTVRAETAARQRQSIAGKLLRLKREFTLWNGSAALNDPDYNDNEGHHQENVNESSQSV